MSSNKPHRALTKDLRLVRVDLEVSTRFPPQHNGCYKVAESAKYARAVRIQPRGYAIHQIILITSYNQIGNHAILNLE